MSARGQTTASPRPMHYVISYYIILKCQGERFPKTTQTLPSFPGHLLGVRGSPCSRAAAGAGTPAPAARCPHRRRGRSPRPAPWTGAGRLGTARHGRARLSVPSLPGGGADSASPALREGGRERVTPWRGAALPAPRSRWRCW